jgi:hypothetical protein
VPVRRTNLLLLPLKCRAATTAASHCTEISIKDGTYTCPTSVFTSIGQMLMSRPVILVHRLTILISIWFKKNLTSLLSVKETIARQKREDMSLLQTSEVAGSTVSS